MFSEELRILDRNTVHLMIDELQMEVDDLNETVNERDETIAAQCRELSKRDKTITAQSRELSAQSRELSAQSRELSAQNEIIKKSITLFIGKATQSGDTKQSIVEQLCEVYGITKEQAEEYIDNISSLP